MKSTAIEHHIFTQKEADHYRIRSILIRTGYVLMVMLLGSLAFFIGEHQKAIAMLLFMTAMSLMIFGYIRLPCPTDVRELAGHEYKEITEMLEYLPELQRDFAEAINDGKALRERDWLYVSLRYRPCKDTYDRNAAIHILGESK